MGELRAVNGLADVRFACNPLSELALSTMIVRYSEKHPFHAAWFRDTAAARRRVGEERILALINPTKDIPDLFMRPAGTKATTFAAELKRVAALPTSRWRADFEFVWPDGLPEDLGRTDRELRDKVCAILSDYWNATMSSYWPSFKAVLDADVMYRARQLVSQGPAATIAEVSDRWVVDGDDLLLPVGRDDYQVAFDAREKPLTMLPTLVKWNHNIPNTGQADLVVSYRARGRGRLWDRPVESAPGLVAVLGRSRTHLLLSLDEPASSTAIGLFLGVTVSAANQHLRALAGAGLLDRRRFGRYVLYSRSEVANQMIAAASVPA